MKFNELQEKIFDIHTSQEFDSVALAVFKFQYESNLVYQHYCNLLKKTPESVQQIKDIPFLPISFFKTQLVHTGGTQFESIFTSSGTTGTETSRHFVAQNSLYEKSFFTAFEQFYPDWKSSAIIGLLPSYLERKGSSLIYMVDQLIKTGGHPESKFQLKADDEFIDFLQNDPTPKIMFGVTFALLELADKNIQLNNTTVIETGGMKGRGKELTREELHQVLSDKLQPNGLHSEYGMTELLSQAYMQNKSFESPAWMKILIRETTDPFNLSEEGRGAINVIDLANINSCSFIATDDLGKLNPNGTFEVLGRLDHAQIRGCNLLVL